MRSLFMALLRCITLLFLLYLHQEWNGITARLILCGGDLDAMDHSAEAQNTFRSLYLQIWFLFKHICFYKKLSNALWSAYVIPLHWNKDCIPRRRVLEVWVQNSPGGNWKTVQNSLYAEMEVSQSWGSRSLDATAAMGVINLSLAKPFFPSFLPHPPQQHHTQTNNHLQVLLNHIRISCQV